MRKCAIDRMSEETNIKTDHSVRRVGLDEKREKDYRMIIFCPCEITTPVAEEALTRFPARLKMACGVFFCAGLPFTFVTSGEGRMKERVVAAEVPRGKVK